MAMNYGTYRHFETKQARHFIRHIERTSEYGYGMILLREVGM